MLDFDPSVIAVREQPFAIEYMGKTRKHRYTPDVLAEFDHRGKKETIVYEIKPRDELKENWEQYKPRFKAAVHYCRTKGWRFKIVTENEIRTPQLSNARFLRRYRSLRADPTICQQLLYTLKALGETTPQGLLAASYWHKEAQMVALPMLWKLITDHQIVAPFHEPITMSSPIWLPE